MKYEREEERVFDAWFYQLGAEEQDRWRSKGILPYAEQPVPGNVFPVIPNHPTWDTLSQGNVDALGNQEEISYISDRELRLRIINLFQILDRFADGRMHLHLIFIRTLLGEDTGTNLAQLCKKFGITKQAMFWRARQIRQALGDIAKGHLAWKAPRRRSGHVRTASPAPAAAKSPKKGAGRNLLPPPPTKRVAARPGVFSRKRPQKRPCLNK